mmetsp:Transcript_20291/g.51931  ORF Transcript_20291/g.51931 Transcript_20291/m.51931 type:complete len:200 (+) Transcript_20291:465-1064(+)
MCRLCRTHFGVCSSALLVFACTHLRTHCTHCTHCTLARFHHCTHAVGMSQSCNAAALLLCTLPALCLCFPLAAVTLLPTTYLADGCSPLTTALCRLCTVLSISASPAFDEKVGSETEVCVVATAAGEEDVQRCFSLSIPACRLCVEEGESLSTIAADFGLSWLQVSGPSRSSPALLLPFHPHPHHPSSPARMSGVWISG